MKKILITGALGQIGSELVIDKNSLYDAAKKHHVDTILHLAALLSSTAESKPLVAWNINMGGLINALETARELNCQFFTSSSIGVFGPSTPKDQTPQVTLERPLTMYGVNKVAGELLCDYYYNKFGLDTRGLRFPGLISYKTPPGGGTTDYAVDIYFEALKTGHYTSYIDKGTYMDMMYMPDAIEATIQLMETDPSRLQHWNAYNISAMSVAPEDIARSIRKHIPSFSIDYKPDPIRQWISDSWPNSLDSSVAKAEWNFQPTYDLEKMTQDMLKNIPLLHTIKQNISSCV